MSSGHEIAVSDAVPGQKAESSEQQYWSKLLHRYPLNEPIAVEAGSSGMNNTTRMVAAGDERYVVRVYNNHRDRDIVELEHEALRKLASQATTFDVPYPVDNKLGETCTVLEDGALAAMFRYIDGERPDSRNNGHVEALGAAAGQLSAALRNIAISGKPQYSPYYELETTFQAVDGDTLRRLTDKSELLAAREQDLALLQKERKGLGQLCREAARLPRQWIHGDLVFNNSVIRDGRIAGLLDFEFITVDARAMEPAVLAVDLLRPTDPDCWSRIGLVVEAFHSFAPLSPEEWRMLPSLMKLRLLDVALHFVVRFQDGLDDDAVLSGILEHAAYGCRQLGERHFNL